VDGSIFSNGTTTPATVASVRQLVDAAQFFWLDLDGVGDETLQLLADVFGVHQLALEDIQHFG
jgi:Mg2+ and Co2+ transporter CorA